MEVPTRCHRSGGKSKIFLLVQLQMRPLLLHRSYRPMRSQWPLLLHHLETPMRYKLHLLPLGLPLLLLVPRSPLGLRPLGLLLRRPPLWVSHPLGVPLPLLAGLRPQGALLLEASRSPRTYVQFHQRQA